MGMDDVERVVARERNGPFGEAVDVAHQVRTVQAVGRGIRLETHRDPKNAQSFHIRCGRHGVSTFPALSRHQQRDPTTESGQAPDQPGTGDAQPARNQRRELPPDHQNPGPLVGVHA